MEEKSLLCPTMSHGRIINELVAEAEDHVGYKRQTVSPKKHHTFLVGVTSITLICVFVGFVLGVIL